MWIAKSSASREERSIWIEEPSATISPTLVLDLVSCQFDSWTGVPIRGMCTRKPSETIPCEVTRTEYQIQVVSSNSQPLDTHDRRCSGCRAEAHKNHALRNAAGMREIGGMKFLERHTCRKSGLQRLRNAFLGKGPVPRQNDAEAAQNQRYGRKPEQHNLSGPQA